MESHLHQGYLNTNFIPQIYEQLSSISTVTIENIVEEPQASGTTPFNTTTTSTAAVVLCISQHDILWQKIYPIFIDVVQNLYKFITSIKYEKFSCFDSSRQ